jgi:hypothetical protein
MADTDYEKQLTREISIGRGWDAVNSVYRNVAVDANGAMKVTFGTQQEQILYVGKHGDDTNDGKSINKPFLTFTAAIAAATALTPAADNRISIKCVDAGSYTEDLTVPEWVGILAESAELIGSHGITQNCLIQCFRLNVPAGGTGITKNGSGGTGNAFCEFVNLNGNAIGFLCLSGEFNIRGQVINVDTGVGIGSLSTNIIHASFRNININGAGGVGIGISSITGMVSAGVDCIEGVNASSTCLLALNGGMLCINCSSIKGTDVAYNVDATSALKLVASSFQGTKILAAGGIANTLLGELQWEDHRFPASNPELDTATSRLQVSHAELGTIYPTNSRYIDVDALGIIDQTSHAAAIGTSQVPHLHWMQYFDVTPHFVLQYRIYWKGEVPPAWTAVKWDVSVNGYVNGAQRVTTFPALDFSAYTSPLKVSILIDYKIFRDVANVSGLFSGADTYPAEVLVKEFDVHYQINSLGSISEISK